MSFWIAAAGLTVFATLLALLPLLKHSAAPAAVRAEHDVEVYGAQLAELKGDLARGTISPAEAASARAEIGRRLLQAAAEAKAGTQAAPRRSLGRAAATVVALAVPAVSLGVYAALGTPAAPDRPLAARAQEPPVGGQDIASLIVSAEERLRVSPEDGQGWEVLAPIYLRVGEAAKAETAFRNAIRLLGETPARRTGLGEALTQRAGGEVTDEALAAFRRALELDPAFLPASFFVALDHSQEGRYAEARGAWLALVEASPPDAPWLPLARSAVADAEAKMGGATPPAAVAATGPGPSQADMDAAAEMSDADRRAMIEGMVTQLAQRLQTSPNDVEGWKRLMRSYAVLGEAQKAREAYAAAAAAFAQGSAEHRDIAAFARDLGLEGTGETAIR